MLETNATSVNQLPDIRVGTVVQVSSQDGKFRFLTSLVDVDAQETIVAHLPSADELRQKEGFANASLNWYEQFFMVNRLLRLRLVDNGVIYAFETSVQEIAGCKSRLLVLDYPQQVTRHNLRSEPRYACELLALVKGEGCSHDGVVKNISYGGCQIRLSDIRVMDEILQLKRSGVPLRYEVKFPHCDRYCELQGRIVSVLEKQDTLWVGVAYDDEFGEIQKYRDILQLH